MQVVSPRQISTALLLCIAPMSCALAVDCGSKIVSVGSEIFRDTSLSSDGKVSCQTCHDPAHAYSDGKRRSVGVDNQAGTRNAPSLLGIANDDSFFWDGRRTTLEDVVLDPFTNPVELGLRSLDEVGDRLRRDPRIAALAGAAFPGSPSTPTTENIRKALSCFIRSLPSKTSEYDRDLRQSRSLSGPAEQGRKLFEGIAHCSECHSLDQGRFSDGRYHHSGIEQTQAMGPLSLTAKEVADSSIPIESLGARVLTDAQWSALGRFVVTRNPADIGAFRTPSLRNVAVTAPYMHDGSIATLSEAVDREIYYRAFSTGNPVSLSSKERRALLAFLETLTDK